MGDAYGRDRKRYCRGSGLSLIHIFLPGYDLLSAKNLAENIRRQIMNMNKAEKDYTLKVLTVSGGISSYPYAAGSMKELVDNADMAVYQVKRRGKNAIMLAHGGSSDSILPGDEGSAYKQDAYSEYASTIYALTAAIDTKDHYTCLLYTSNSPLFGKDQMTTFERCFIADKKTHKEHTAEYYSLINNKAICEKILEEFGLDPKTSHILNGHVPVKIKDGESPVKGEGKLIVIDGGISKAYQKQTGIAGYTFIFNSRYMALSEHKPYEPLKEDGTQVFHTPKITTLETLRCV